MKNQFQYTLTVTDPGSGKSVTYDIPNEHTLIAKTAERGSELFTIKIKEGGKMDIQFSENMRTPEDAGKCLLYCAEGCNGDLLCVAGCALECATIII